MYREADLGSRREMRRMLRDPRPGPASEATTQWIEAEFARVDQEDQQERELRHQAELERTIERRLARGQGVQAQRLTKALLERVARS